VSVPCGQNDHWRRIRIHLLVASQHIDVAAIRGRFGAAETTPVILADNECRTELFITSLPEGVPAPTSGGPKPDIGLYFHTERKPRVKDHSTPPSHDDFFVALSDAIREAGPCLMGVSVELIYPESEARWRIPLLAQPPQLTEPQSALGKIELAGMTLRFTESPVNIFEASFNRTPDVGHLLVALSFGFSLDTRELADLYPRVLEQAENWSSLFVDTGVVTKSAPTGGGV